MHIPDGILKPNLLLAGWLISISAVIYCLKKVKATLKDRAIPLMGVAAAFIFTAQAIDFPLLGGTAHLLGQALAVVLLGPYAAVLVMTAVLAVQCFIFQDGGLTALGANVFNMAFVGPIGGYFVYRLASRVFKKSLLPAVGLAAWFAVVLSATFYALELAFSGVFPFKILLSSMILIHAVVGMAEAVITCLVIGFIIKVRRDLIYQP